MKKLKFFLLSVFALTFVAACGGGSGGSTEYDVYVAGYERKSADDVAKVWKNGVPQDLANGAHANSVFVAGDDVYVAGAKGKFWKNGVPQNLDSTNYSCGNSVFVVGDDVYVAGYEMDGVVNVAKLWKNGVSLYNKGAGPVKGITNGTNDASADSVFVVGDDVYVAGGEFNGTHYVAKLWKNGVPQDLANDAYAHSVFVAGDDVYVAGNEGNVAKLWKNDVSQNLTNGTNYAYANSVFVVGDDVYVAGVEYGTVNVAKLWKNGVSLYNKGAGPVKGITNGTNDASADSVFVVGDDVYVTGSEFNGTQYVAKLWKNGVPQNLTDGLNNAYARSVFLVPRK